TRRSSDLGVALEGDPLHVRVQAALAAELLAAAGAAGAAVEERGQGGAGAGALGGHLRGAEVEPAGPRAGRGDEAGDPVAVVGVGRADEAALAPRDERGREVRIAVVRPDGDDGAEDLVIVERRARHRRRGQGHDRADEVAGAPRDAGGLDLAGAAEAGGGGRREPGEALADVAELLRRRERAHADLLARRIADHDRAEPLA